MIDRYADNLVVLWIHLPVYGDTYWSAWGNARANTFYDFQYIPMWAVDSLDWIEGTVGVWEGMVNARQAIPTDVTIESESRPGSGSSIDVTASVCIEAGGVGRTMRIYMVQLLDNYPPVAPYYRNCTRGSGLTQDITLAPGECLEVQGSLALDAPSSANPLDVMVAVWAQEPNPAFPAEVFQADVSQTFLISRDGFESGDTLAWSATVP